MHGYIKDIFLCRKTKRVLFFLFVVLIIVLALFPRSIEVLNQNPVFGFDQGRDYLAVKNIVVDHKLTLIGEELGAGSAGISGIFQGPDYYYLLAIPFLIFAGNPNGGVFLMWILSILSIALGYYLGKKLFGNYGGLLVVLLMTISPMLISQARFVWNPHTPTLFVLITFYFLYKVVREQKPLDIFLVAFFAGFIYNFELAISIPLSLTILLFCIYLFRKNFIRYLYLLLGFFIAFLPMMIFEIRHNFLALHGLFLYFSHKGFTFGLPLSYYLLDHAKYFVYDVKDTLPGINFYAALFLLGAFFIIGISFLLSEKDLIRKKFIIFLLLLPPVSFLVFAFLKNTVWTYYLSDLSLGYIFISSYILSTAYERNAYLVSVFSTCLVIGLVIFAAYSAYRVSLYDYSDYGGTAKLKGKIDAINYIYKDAKGKPFGLLVFTPPIYTYAYDYLIWWYGVQKYHFIPYKKKTGTFYLLIEKDPSKPWTYKGWLKTVIKTGKVIYIRTLPSGFIIQKRIGDRV